MSTGGASREAGVFGAWISAWISVWTNSLYKVPPTWCLLNNRRRPVRQGKWVTFTVTSREGNVGFQFCL